jgi:hypothetical protein
MATVENKGSKCEGIEVLREPLLHFKLGFIPCLAIAQAVRRWLIIGEERGSIPGENVIFMVEEVELEHRRTATEAI